jgi:hypothetical protein
VLPAEQSNLQNLVTTRLVNFNNCRGGSRRIFRHRARAARLAVDYS